VVVMPDTVIHGSPLDPVEEFRSHPLPTFERRGDFQDIIYEVAEGSRASRSIDPNDATLSPPDSL